MLLSPLLGPRLCPRIVGSFSNQGPPGIRLVREFGNIDYLIRERDGPNVAVRHDSPFRRKVQTVVQDLRFGVHLLLTVRVDRRGPKVAELDGPKPGLGAKIGISTLPAGRQQDDQSRDLPTVPFDGKPNAVRTRLEVESRRPVRCQPGRAELRRLRSDFGNPKANAFRGGDATQVQRDRTEGSGDVAHGDYHDPRL